MFERVFQPLPPNPHENLCKSPAAAVCDRLSSVKLPQTAVTDRRYNAGKTFTEVSEGVEEDKDGMSAFITQIVWSA